MADMYGAVRSNEFRVKDVVAFRAWFDGNVRFGHEIQTWFEDGGLCAFGGYEMYPSAYPMLQYDEDVDGDPEWDLNAFAEAIRPHLAEGEEFRVFAAGHEKLRYVAASHLIISHDKVEFNCYAEGD